MRCPRSKPVASRTSWIWSSDTTSSLGRKKCWCPFRRNVGALFVCGGIYWPVCSSSSFSFFRSNRCLSSFIYLLAFAALRRMQMSRWHVAFYFYLVLFFPLPCHACVVSSGWRTRLICLAGENPARNTLAVKRYLGVCTPDSLILETHT